MRKHTPLGSYPRNQADQKLVIFNIWIWMIAWCFLHSRKLGEKDIGRTVPEESTGDGPKILHKIFT